VAPKHVLVRLGLAGALVLIVAATASAAGTLDQQSTTSNNAHAVAGTLKPAQVFTAGITGQLDQVDLYLVDGPMSATPAGDLTVEIWTVSGDGPGSKIGGASATVLRGAVTSAAWVHVPISAPSVAGTQYAIVLSSSASSLGDCPDVCWSWLADDNNPYAGGLSYYTLNGGPWVAQARDLAFKTYVTPTAGVQVYLAGAGEGANGSVTSSPAGIDCGATCLASFGVGSQLTLTAHPAVTATFGYWDGGPCDKSTNPICTFTVPGSNVETTAAFYGKAETAPPPPSAAPSATAAHATPKPSAKASPTPVSSQSATVEPTLEPSDELVPTGSAAAQTAGETPGPTTVPTVPTSGSGDSSILPLVIVIGLLIAVAAGAGGWLAARRRPAGPTP